MYDEVKPKTHQKHVSLLFDVYAEVISHLIREKKGGQEDESRPGLSDWS